MELNSFIKLNLDDFDRRLNRTLRGLSSEELTKQPHAEANSIAFVVWHTTRVEDRIIQTMARDVEEVWVRDGWYGRLGLPRDVTGINYPLEQLAEFPALSADDMRGYLNAVRAETLAYLDSVTGADFDAILDRNPFPEVPGADKYFDGWTTARMFEGIIAEHFQHLGHAAYVRGLQRGMDG